MEIFFFQVSTILSNMFTYYIQNLEIYNAFIISEPEFTVCGLQWFTVVYTVVFLGVVRNPKEKEEEEKKEKKKIVTKSCS